MEELQAVATEVGLPKFAGGQLARWLYVARVRSIAEMTNISKEKRAALEEKYEVGLLDYCLKQESKDGTKKYLFPVEGLQVGTRTEESAVEAVMIPSADRKTICVSCQSGCKMACKFCMTGRQGFHGDLSAADIISQFIAIDEGPELTNAVFMGMGEPMDNYENVMRSIEILTAPWGFAWSPKRITVSTIGVLPTLKRFLEESKCHLAVSLHTPFPEERFSIMPVQKAYPIQDVVSLIKQYDFSGQRRVSFEYTMFGGLNDDPRHAHALARLVRGLECRVNLIRFHRIPDFKYDTASDEAILAFQKALELHGVTATVRASRGQDIFAACGLLAGKQEVNKR